MEKELIGLERLLNMQLKKILLKNLDLGIAIKEKRSAKDLIKPLNFLEKTLNY